MTEVELTQLPEARDEFAPGDKTTTVQPTGEDVTPEQSREPCAVECQWCDDEVMTRTKLKSGKYQTMWCCAVFLLGGAACCLCLYPCCHEKFHDVAHLCPSCGRVVGVCKAK